MMPGMQGGCPMCGTMQRDQTEIPNEAGEIRRQIDHLQRRLDEVERGQTTPQQAQQQMPMMCPMCQGMMGGVRATPSRTDMEQGIESRIQQLEERLGALEGSRR